jgi:hypothetical protein
VQPKKEDAGWAFRCSKLGLMLRYDAPGRHADRHRLHHFEVRHVDHRHVVAVSIGGEQQFLVRRQRQLPDPLADQEILLDFEFLRVDDRMPMKGTTIRIELPIQRSKAKRARIAELVSD